MISVYEIHFTRMIDPSKDKKSDPTNIFHDSSEEMQMEEMGPQEILGQFHLGAHSIIEAYSIAEDILPQICENEEYNIIKVEERQDIFLLNWQEEEECECPYCSVETCAPDDIIKFTCPKCGEELIVADNGWEVLMCKNCEKELKRNKLKEVAGQFIYEDKKPRSKKSKPDATE